MMGICNKLAWPIPSMFIVWLLGKDVHLIGIEDLSKPFWIIIVAFLALGVLAFLAPLPEVKAAGEDDSEEEEESAVCTYAATKTSVFQFTHLLLGCLALFLYVGVETVSLGTLVDYANSLGLPGAANYAWIAPIGIVIGYICGIILIPKYISQAVALKLCSFLAIAGALLVVLTPAEISIYFISLMALGCSLMWPALWPLAMADLGKFTKSGSSLLINGDVWWSRSSYALWKFEGCSRCSAGILALSPLLPLHFVLQHSRLQDPFIVSFLIS